MIVSLQQGRKSERNPQEFLVEFPSRYRSVPIETVGIGYEESEDMVDT